jgi:hypothetical protein
MRLLVRYGTVIPLRTLDAMQRLWRCGYAIAGTWISLSARMRGSAKLLSERAWQC